MNAENASPDPSYDERMAEQAQQGVGPAPGDETGVKAPDENGGNGAEKTEEGYDALKAPDENGGNGAEKTEEGYDALTVPELQDEVRNRGAEDRLETSVSEARKDDLIAALEAADADEGR